MALMETVSKAAGEDSLSKLRAPFPADKIGKLPKATIKSEDYKKLDRAHCNTCGGYHPATATIHLDFVGHADITERLLDIDPFWNWEPMGHDADGLPAMTRTGAGPSGLWIKLTVCGVTRIGFGSVTPGAFDAEKQLIGDALRNAAMRFGMALDLWRKEPPHVDEPARRNTAANRAADNGGTPVPRLTTVSFEPIGTACPDCGDGDLGLKTLSDGRRFIGCSHYPACKFTRLPEGAPA